MFELHFIGPLSCFDDLQCSHSLRATQHILAAIKVYFVIQKCNCTILNAPFYSISKFIWLNVGFRVKQLPALYESAFFKIREKSAVID